MRALGVVFPFVLFIFFPSFRSWLPHILSLSESHISNLSCKLPIKQSASHTAVTALHPLRTPCSSPAQAFIHVCCALRHSTICPHQTYLVQQIHFPCSGYSCNKIRLRGPHCLEKDDSKPLSTIQDQVKNQHQFVNLLV